MSPRTRILEEEGYKILPFFFWFLLQTLKDATITMVAAAILALHLREAISANVPGAWCCLRITTLAKVVRAQLLL